MSLCQVSVKALKALIALMLSGEFYFPSTYTRDEFELHLSDR